MVTLTEEEPEAWLLCGPAFSCQGRRLPTLKMTSCNDKHSLTMELSPPQHLSFEYPDGER